MKRLASFLVITFLLSAFAFITFTGRARSQPTQTQAAPQGGSPPQAQPAQTQGDAARPIAPNPNGSVAAQTGEAREGRSWVWDIRPRWKDAADVWHNFLYYAGLRSVRPKIARFGYAEKAEYWAVIWGTVVMGLTGLMIWFKVGAFGFLPRWWIDIAIAVHFYEAVLATLAIVVWHFYHVVFDPEVYPVNFAFYDGRVSEEFYKEEHELAYEQLK